MKRTLLAAVLLLVPFGLVASPPAEAQEPRVNSQRQKLSVCALQWRRYEERHGIKGQPGRYRDYSQRCLRGVEAPVAR